MATGFGIEIGPAGVRGARIERQGAEARLIAIDEVPCDPANGDALMRSLVRLRQVLQMTRPVVVGLPGTAAVVATVRPLVVDARRSATAVRFELQQQLPFELADAAWHYGWLSANGRGGARVPLPPPRAAVVAAMKRSLLEERLAVCRRAGIAVGAVSLSPVALVNVCQLQRSKLREKPGALLRVFDDQSGEWVVWTADEVQVASVRSPSPEAFPQDVEAAWRGLQDQQPGLPKSAWVLGDAAALMRLQPALSGRCGLQTERFDPTQAVTSRSARSEALERASAALGLALQAVGMARLPLNLLATTQEERRSGDIRQGAWAMSAVCAVTAAGLAVSGMWELRRRRVAVLDALITRERQYQEHRPEIRALLRGQQRGERLSARLQQLAEASHLVAQLFAQTTQAMPDEVWLTKATHQATDAGIEGVLEGRAHTFQDVNRLLERLKAVPGISAVKTLSTAVVQEPAGGSETVAFAVQYQRPLASPPPASEEPEA